ncbi:hypothetical protein RclHR1_07540002 [Rhizophagus clarus]|uniref:HAT C-terminal dimerisation domain-containing protein n=1 Tax=Rhizophagus clarus TaxID=94130 RepID=A0A2Z6RXK9_9GLOM|nr:hypothetical protein RclHR1_07540002 [Rhizophagus clarus]
MASLKKKFTPRPDKNETVKTYLMLVYGESYEENDDDEITDDDIPSAEEEDEISRYIKLQDIRIKDDPLMWWSNHKDSFPTLVQLAKKYLSIPSTLMLSE